MHNMAIKTWVCSLILFQAISAEDQELIMAPDGRMVNIFDIEPDLAFANNPDWLVDGDILYTEEQARNVAPQSNYWTELVIPIKFDPTFSENSQNFLNISIGIVSSRSCLQFRDVTYDSSFNTSEHHVYFTDNKKGCFAHLGKVNKFPQLINLGPGCHTIRAMLHETGHMLGLRHEHQRFDRDSYIRVLWDNLKKPLYLATSAYHRAITRNFCKDYDYRSVMHYQPASFSKSIYEWNAMQTLDPRKQFLMGWRYTLSFKDEKIINQLYCEDKSRTDCGVYSEDFCDKGYLLPNCTCNCPPGVTGQNCEFGEEEEFEFCGEVAYREGQYRTPGFPNRLPNLFNRNCIWVIKGPEDKRVQVYFDTFDFHDRMDIWPFKNVCYWDRIEVRVNGSNSDEQMECGSFYDKQTLISNGSEFVILIRSLGLYHHRKGMQFNVTFV